MFKYLHVHMGKVCIVCVVYNTEGITVQFLEQFERILVSYVNSYWSCVAQC